MQARQIDRGKGCTGVPAYRHYRADPRCLSNHHRKAPVILLDELSDQRDERDCGLPGSTQDGVPKSLDAGTQDRHRRFLGGVTAATNDVGILQAPHGGLLSLAVFIGGSRAPEPARAPLMAQLAAAVIAHYQ